MNMHVNNVYTITHVLKRKDWGVLTRASRGIMYTNNGSGGPDVHGTVLQFNSMASVIFLKNMKGLLT